MGLTEINRGNWQEQLIKQKTTFGPFRYGTALPTTMHGFAVCICDKTDGVKRCPLSGAGDWVTNFAGLLKT